MSRCAVTADLNRYMRQLDSEAAHDNAVESIEQELREERHAVMEPLEADHPARLKGKTILWSIVDDKGGYWRDEWAIDEADAKKQIEAAWADMAEDVAKDRAEAAAEDAAVSRWENSQY